MPSEPLPPATARAQLEALAADRDFAGPWATERARMMPAAGRPAAVLVLFGVLDDLPAADAPTSSVADAPVRAAETPAPHDAAPREPDARPIVSRDLDVLLLARATTLRSHPGQVAFPGGRVDAHDADVTAAALREAHEETGLDLAGVDVLGELASIPVPASGHLVTPVLAWWRRPSAVRVVDVAESSAVFRAPVADLLSPASRFTSVTHHRGSTWRGPAFVVPDPRTGEERVVWGFTAGVLDAMFDRLGWTLPWDASRTLDVPA
ncbi:CoA pyrophosphatase [Microbacterium oryzae]|uniref:CoA pyrophosphatase n=1 Tax=Microbacterium oryzae TaxID=743009 RepID=A0A6I6DPB2_9MICO|nr:CoA pyrophosphatase [Microbacterium oryzae]QGU26745.1 CoA pyrophosphatase [Microbacterium oryzae]